MEKERIIKPSPEVSFYLLRYSELLKLQKHVKTNSTEYLDLSNKQLTDALKRCTAGVYNWLKREGFEDEAKLIREVEKLT